MVEVPKVILTINKSLFWFEKPVFKVIQQMIETQRKSSTFEACIETLEELLPRRYVSHKTVNQLTIYRHRWSRQQSPLETVVRVIQIDSERTRLARQLSALYYQHYQLEAKHQQIERTTQLFIRTFFHLIQSEKQETAAAKKTGVHHSPVEKFWQACLDAYHAGALDAVEPLTRKNVSDSIMTLIQFAKAAIATQITKTGSGE